MKRPITIAVAGASLLGALPLFAQGTRSVDLTVNNVGISIGDSRRVTGLRLNYRDRDLREVVGINATIWMPHEGSRGDVRGLALGLPATGARRIEGIAAGIIGIGVHDTMRGLAIGGIGMGVGEDMRGIALGGIGMGVGQDLRGIAAGGIGLGIGQDLRGLGVGGIGMGIGGELRGIAIAGLGAGVGGDMEGLAVAGLGVGTGGNAKGVLIAGLGAGVGQDMKGLSIAGVGVGAGGDVRGVTLTGIGLGAGGNVTGVQVAGIGIGAGGTLKWVSVAGLGIGAPRIKGVAIASAVGGEDVSGLVIAPIYFRIANSGQMNGVNVSAFNNVRGTQQGLAIGIFNYARSLDGVQIGLLNYAGNKRRGTRLLPIANYARKR